MYAFLIVLHYFVCFALVVVVLLQSGKGGGLAGAFGGGGTTLFGGRGAATFLTKATMILGGLFFAISLSLALMSTTRGPGLGKSLIQEEARRAAGRNEGGATSTRQPVPGAPSGGTLPGAPAATPSASPQTGPQTAPASGAPAAPSTPPPSKGGGK